MGRFYRTPVPHCLRRSYFHSSLRLFRQFSANFEVAHVLTPGRHCCPPAATGAWRSEVSREWCAGLPTAPPPHQVLHICWYEVKYCWVDVATRHPKLMVTVVGCLEFGIGFLWRSDISDIFMVRQPVRRGRAFRVFSVSIRTRIIDFYSNINEFTKGYQPVT